MSNNSNIKHLLQNVEGIIKHHDELRKMKGEDFNIFYVLKIHKDEERTHSRFIAELLNPNGRHHFSTKFLDLFLEVISHSNETDKNYIHKNNFIVSPKATVVVEEYISKVDLENGTGGSIDIYLKDEKGNSISIENKIYAGDQPKQLIRYHNHNKENSTLYYLTLDNTKKVSEKSIKHNDNNGNIITLTENKDYFPITYKDHIRSWLKLCLKEAAEQPILRETIRQYIILIKKLTHTMTDQEKYELAKIFIKNLDAANKVADSFYTIINEYQDKLRTAVFDKLNQSDLKNEFKIKKGNDIHSKVAQIWLSPDVRNCKIRYGIETFNGNGKNNDGNLFIGIYDKHQEGIQLENTTSLRERWPHYKELLFEGKNINLMNEEILRMIIEKDSEKFNKVVDAIFDQTIEFIGKTKDLVFNYCNKNSEI